MFAKLARAVVARPWVVIVGWLLAAGAIIGLSPNLSGVTNSDQSQFLPSSSESVRANELAKRAFPQVQGATAVIVVKRADGAPLAQSDLASVGQLAQRLNADRPTGLRGVAFDPQRSISPNALVALLGAQFAGASEDPSVLAAVTSLRQATDQALVGTGLQAGMTGEAAIVVDNKRAFADTEKIVTLVTLGLIVLLLLVIFRSPVAALLPLGVVGLVFAITTALVAAAGTTFDFQVGQELPTMLTVVLFGIGTDYILFLLFRYRERLRAGDTPQEAIVTAVQRVGEAILSAAFAVIAAFGALVLAALGFFTTLGPALAIGVFITLLAALTLVPAIVVLLGRAVFWPSRSTHLSPRRSGFAALGRLVARRPAAVVLAGVVLLGGLSAGALLFKADYDPINQLPPSTEASKAFGDLKRGFPAGALQPTQVYLTGARPFTSEEIGGFVTAMAAADGVAAPLAPQVSPDGQTVVVPLVLKADPYSAEALDLLAGPLGDAARAAAPSGAAVLLGGQSKVFADVRSTSNRDLRLIFPVAGALFVLILAMMLRSLLAPVYLVALVVGGFAATLGAATLLFQTGLGNAGLAFTIPIILYLFVTAIGTDYNILMTARLREELSEGRSPREAAALAIEHAGPSVGAAALILAGTFGALLVSGVPFFREIGFAVTLGIVLVAYVISLLLVPAATVLLGQAAWWPARVGARAARLPSAQPSSEAEPSPAPA